MSTVARFLFSSLAGLVACTLLGSCAQSNLGDQSRQAYVTELSAADNGRQVTMAVGDSLKITLAGNPTTGFTWAVLPQSVNDQVLQASEAVRYIADQPQLVGSGGSFVYNYTALKSGVARLDFGYRRSWENVDPIQNWSVTVMVR
jgi:inhibitor of cysteine peptidase